MREKAEQMKPILLKAGIPLALTLVGFLFSIAIRGKRRSNQHDQVGSVDGVLHGEEFQEQDDSYSLDSTSLGHNERLEEVNYLLQIQDSVSLETLQIQCPDESSESKAVIKQEVGESNLKEEFEDPNKQVGALQDMEGDLEAWFLHYCRLQEYGSALKELQSALELEMAHVEFLGEKVKSMAAENRRLEATMAEYPRVIKALQSEVGLLRRRMKKLWKMNREGILVLRRQALVIKAKEGEISRKEEELQWKEGERTELANAIAELRGAVDQMEAEKKALMEKLEMRESLATPTSKDEDDELIGDYSQLRIEYKELLYQLEQFQKERSTDADELIYLRWVNGCLRHELAKSQQGPEDEEKGKRPQTEIAGNDDIGHCNMGYNLAGSLMGAEHGEANAHVAATKPAGSSKRVLHKLKKWVKGKEKQRGSFHEQERCSVSCSASDNLVEDVATARSLSSHVKPCGGGNSTV